MGWRILEGDVLERLADLEDGSVHCVVTSPPYWGLRDYGVGGQLGLEETPEEYVAQMVEVFREVRRVLRDDGTVWLNLGDSYAGSWGAQSRTGDEGGVSGPQIANHPRGQTKTGSLERTPGLKPKDLVGIPWRVAFALQADGWWLRSDIIWSKPNPMPESVTDRPTKAHEYVFLLTKSARYFYDANAVREPHAEASLARARRNRFGGKYDGADAAEHGRLKMGENYGPDGDPDKVCHPEGRNRRTVWEIATQPFPDAHFACVDEDTECLTIEGWKRHDELRPGMLAAQYHMGNGMASWAKIEDVARYEVEGLDMVAAKSRDVALLLTPNHRTVVCRRHPRTRQWQDPVVVRADELKKSHAIPVSAPWRCPDGEEPVDPTWAELLGWYIAEGCETVHEWAVEIYQSKSVNPEKVDRIRSLLTAVGADFSEATATRQWRGEKRILSAFQVRGYAAARLREVAPGKRLPERCLWWSEGALTALLDGLVGGDGHRRDDGRFSFVQRSKASADMVQAIGVRLGYATMISRRSEGTHTVYFTTKRVISFRGTAGEGADIGTRAYTGIVWCPKLPAGTWIARKGGRAFITGNTFPPKLVEPCIKAGTSEKGCCPGCGAPWERVVERTAMEVRPGPQRAATDAQGLRTQTSGTMTKAPTSTTTGWQPTCDHEAEPVPCTVLDPFSGSGTTGMVALRLGRSYVGIELNPEYAEMSRRRIDSDCPLFNRDSEEAA